MMLAINQNSVLIYAIAIDLSLEESDGQAKHPYESTR